MTFPNAYHGVKKIFTAEILGLIGAVCLILGSLIGVLAVVSTVAGSEGGAAASGIGTIIFLAAGAVLPIIGYIMNLVGLNQASKDDSNFRVAFMVAIISLIVLIVSAVFSVFNFGNGMADNIAKAFSIMANIIVTVYVITGISSLAEQLKKPEMVEMGRKILIFIIVINGIIMVAEILPVFFGINVTVASIEGIMGVVSAVCQFIYYIVYLVFLGKAKAMLQNN